MRRVSSAARSGGCWPRSKPIPTLSPTRTSLRFRTSSRAPRTGSKSHAATTTNPCAGITPWSGPSRRRSAPRCSTAPSPRCPSRLRPPHRRRRPSTSATRAEVKQLLAVLWLALFALATPVAAQTFPPLTGRVVDQAHLLTPEQVADITSKSAALEAQSGRQFVVATVNSLEGSPVEDYAYRLLRFWKLGSAKNNDGVLLVVAPNEHKVAITTGYGAGAYMTDAMSGVIIREDILPHFKQNPPDYGGGIEAGADAIVKQMSLPPDEAAKNVAAATQAQQQRRHSGGSPLPALFWFMVIGFVALSHFRLGAGSRYRGRHGGISPWVMLWGLNALSNSGRGGWGGGSSWGGGGGGFGGFSGGG